MQNTAPLLVEETDFPALTRVGVSTLQVNLGYVCNLSCSHCHVNAGPNRTETMTADVADLIEQVLVERKIKTLDLTGGAPELSSEFRRLVKFARDLDIEVIDRCNLTILLEQGQQDLAEFLASHGVTIVASLPCYQEENVNQQRGKGVYAQSIAALKKLNKLGYGKKPGLKLNLVYNPVGAYLPPSQKALEDDYSKSLWDDHGIQFNELFTITNMPISRFGAVLLAQGKYKAYMDLLKNNYSEKNLETLMCKDTVSVDYQGYLYDCDFNQMLDQPIIDRISSNRKHLRDLLSSELNEEAIFVGEHCYGCTAGQGSSCGGALAEG